MAHRRFGSAALQVGFDGYALWEHGAATYRASTAHLWHTTDGGAAWSPVKTLP
jgi:hypothetical protein